MSSAVEDSSVSSSNNSSTTTATTAPSTPSSTLSPSSSSSSSSTTTSSFSASSSVVFDAAQYRRLRWSRKHQAVQRYAHEHNHDPAWFKHSKHFLICTWSGRPVYTKYGDDSKLAAYMGVITAIISNFQRIGENVQFIQAGPWKFVFVIKGPIYLICISRTSESVQQLVNQLNYAHTQILSVLTGSVNQLLQDRPAYDIRQLMGGTESLLTDLLNEADRSYCFLLDSLSVLRLPRVLRSKVGACLKRSGTKSIVYGLLLCGSKLVHIVRGGKDKVLHPSDALILLNFLLNSQSLRTSAESYTPICLPKFSEKGFLSAYVSYLTDDICLTLLTADASDITGLRTAKQKIVDALQKRDCLSELTLLYRSGSCNVRLEEMELHQLDVRQLIYKSELHGQVVCAGPAIGTPFAEDKRMNKWLFRRFQRVLSRITAPNGTRKHTFYFEVSDLCSILAWCRPGDFLLLMAFGPLVEKLAAMAAATKAIKWIQKEQQALFI